MTLCVAWRLGRNVYLAADSLLGTSAGHAFNIAPKLFVIPTNILGVIDEQGKEPQGNYRHTLGLAYTTEDVTSTAVFKEIFAGLCMSAQYIGDPRFMPFTLFTELAAKVYRLVMDKAKAGSDLSDMPEMYLAGWSGESNRTRVFKISPAPDGSTRPEVIECLTTAGPFAYDCVGAGAAAMSRRIEALGQEKKPDMANAIHRGILLQFRSLIESKEVPSVGGTIQFGQFVSEDFVIQGLVYPPGSTSSGQPRLFCYNIDIRELQVEAARHTLHITGNFVAPFPLTP